MATTADDRARGAVWGMFVGEAHVRGDDAAPHADGGAAWALLQSLVAPGGFDALAYATRLLRAQTAAPEPPCLGAGAAAIARLAPLVVRYAGMPALMLHVDAATRVVDDDDRTIAYACAHAWLLQDLLAGADLRAALARLSLRADARTGVGQELREIIGDALAASASSVVAPCAVSEVFVAALRTAFAHAEDAAAALDACAGADPHRAMLVGSWLGAALGADGLPAGWRARLATADPIDVELTALLQARAARAPAGVMRH